MHIKYIDQKRLRTTILLVLLSALLVSCSILPRSWRRKEHFPPDYLQSENPVEQVKAIHQIVDEKNLQYVGSLIDLMMSEEPSVRNHAYWGVTELTGKIKPDSSEVVYHYYDTKEARQKSVESWRDYWRQVSSR